MYHCFPYYVKKKGTYKEKNEIQLLIANAATGGIHNN